LDLQNSWTAFSIANQRKWHEGRINLSEMEATLWWDDETLLLVRVHLRQENASRSEGALVLQLNFDC
jgi:hypothetical protein